MARGTGGRAVAAGKPVAGAFGVPTCAAAAEATTVMTSPRRNFMATSQRMALDAKRMTLLMPYDPCDRVVGTQMLTAPYHDNLRQAPASIPAPVCVVTLKLSVSRPPQPQPCCRACGR